MNYRKATAAALSVLVSTAAALAAAEWIAGKMLRPDGARAAAAAGVPWDPRDRLQAVADERRSTGRAWYPAVPANTYLERELQVDGRRAIPLGGVAEVSVIGCNENGYFSAFETDEFGFNNPRGLHSAPGAKLVFVGDSFTQGDCLRQGATIVDRVRAQRPQTINLATGGNGPLFELAALREYVRPDHRATVVWMYYEGNDLDDLRRDRADPLLARYLEPAFTQNLAQRQASVNAAVQAMVDERFAQQMQERPRVLPHLRLLVWQARQRLRARPGSAIQTGGPEAGDGDAADVAMLLRILAAARDEVAGKGGRLVFVYLPEYWRYAGSTPSPGAQRRDEVLAGVRALGLPVVDLHEVFARQDRPELLFPFGVKGHYNDRGAEVAASALLEALPP